MKNATTAVQPNSGKRPDISIQSSNKHVVRLVECGGDLKAANSLVERLTEGRAEDKFERASIDSFIALIAALSNAGGRLTSVR